MAATVYGAEAQIDTLAYDLKRQDYRLKELRTAAYGSQQAVAAGVDALNTLKQKQAAKTEKLTNQLTDVKVEAKKVAKLQAQVEKLEVASSKAKEEYRRVAEEKVELQRGRAQMEADAFSFAEDMEAEARSLNETILSLNQTIEARDEEIDQAEERIRELEAEVNTPHHATLLRTTPRHAMPRHAALRT